MIDRAVKRVANQLNFETGTIECDLGKSCNLFVDVECHDSGWYREMEITGISISKETGCCYSNIAEYIGNRLGIEAAKINADEYQSEMDYCYQKEYESKLEYL